MIVLANVGTCSPAMTEEVETESVSDTERVEEAAMPEIQMNKNNAEKQNKIKKHLPNTKIPYII